MRVSGLKVRAIMFSAVIGVLAPMSAGQATTTHSSSTHRSYAARGHSVAQYSRGGLQCVPFARDNSGIEISGNAATWWNNAEGVYQRGARPEVGSILNFRANGHMRMGHVAVVSDVTDPRTIEIDHANWAGPGGGRGAISRNITVVDVSPNNDWTAVRVALGHTGTFGSVYPTYGFIYDRPDAGVLLANDVVAPAPVLNAPPRDLRPAAERMMASTAQDSEEVAEAVDDAQPRARRIARRAHGTHAALTRATVTKVHAVTSTSTSHKPHAKRHT